jgi:excisionase family DNA binding protein
MQTEFLAFSIQETARRLGVCPRTIANLVRNKQLLSRKIGRRRLIPVASLEAFLRQDHAIQPALRRTRCAGDDENV